MNMASPWSNDPFLKRYSRKGLEIQPTLPENTAIPLFTFSATPVNMLNACLHITNLRTIKSFLDLKYRDVRLFNKSSAAHLVKWGSKRNLLVVV
jgi:hypothetical protein